MISKKLRATALALALGCITAAAQAAPVTYTFAATVFDVASWGNGGGVNYGDVAGLHAEVGDKITGKISWDAATATSPNGPQSDENGTYQSYGLSSFNIEYTFLSGRYSYSTPMLDFVDVYDNVTGDSITFLGTSTRTLQGKNLNTSFGFGFGDNSTNLWNSTAMPANIPASLIGNIGGFGGSVGENTGSPSDSGFQFNSLLTSLQLQPVSTLAVSAVPEPGTYAMFLAGLGAIGIAARRRRNNAA